MYALLAVALLPSTVDEFRDLFNGRDLSGWVVEGPATYKMDGQTKPMWAVEEGIIVCAGRGFGFLRYEKELSDFVLRVEYRFQPPSKTNARGNSGLGIRTGPFDAKRSRESRPSYAGYEIQLLDDAGKPANPYGSGSLYRYIGPKSNPVKPAPEWNVIEVECRGPKIKITINGEPVLDVDQNNVPDIKDPADKPDTALPPKDKPLKGYISLQSHSGRVEFRKVQLRELTGSACK